MNKPLRKAVFPVAGFGTRFLPATKAIPKEMIQIASKPIIQHVFEEAVAAGIKEFIFITGRNKEVLSNHFDHSYELEDFLKNNNKLDLLQQVQGFIPEDATISFIRQKQAKGLGHAVLCAKKLIGGDPFAVLLPDELVLHKKGALSQMVEVYNKLGGNILAIKDVDPSQVEKYGIITPDNADISSDNKVIKIASMVEKPKIDKAPSTLSITGRYIFQPEIFEFIEATENGTGGEIQLTDAMQRMVKVSPFYGLEFEGQRFDCGNQVGSLEANIAYSLANPKLHDSVIAILKNYIK